MKSKPRLQLRLLLQIQSTPVNPDTEGTEENRPDTAESGLAGVKYIEFGLKGQNHSSGCRGAEISIDRCPDWPELTV